MSRVIKFRLWSGQANEMIQHPFTVAADGKSVKVTVALAENDDVESVSAEFAISENPELHLMQFTGLKDKNGAEIYEGDVLALVRCPFRHLSCTCEKRADPHFISEVSFERGAFCVEGLSGDVSQYEVIGNIHEHPHLLESAS